MTRRQRQQRRWVGDAYTLWIEHEGRYTLRQCTEKTAPPWATEDDRREALCLTIAESQALHEAIIDAIGG